MPLKDNAANDVLDSQLGSDHSSRFPATWYATLYSTNPDPVALTGGVEAAYAGFARVAIANTSANFPNATNRQKTLVTAIQFAVPAVDTPDFLSVGLHRAAVGDVLYRLLYLPSPIRASAGGSLVVPASTLLVAM